MGYSSLDTSQIDGQIELFEKELPGDLFAVSRIFAAAKKQMNLAEYKALTYALSHVKWSDECPEVLYLDKKELAQAVGIHSDSDHLSVDLHKAIGKMPNHSFLSFADKDRGIYDDGNFVRRITMFKNFCRIKLEPDYLCLFGNLDGHINQYITMWSSDIYKMGSERSVIFYELLRDHADTRQEVNTCEVGIKALKELFGIPKDGEGSYMRKTGHFDRLAFEKRVIDPLCDDLANCEMIQLVIQSNGKAYEKIKTGNRVQGYRFLYMITTRPQTATATEVAEISEAIRKDGQILKIAKDIINGDKKSKEKKPNFKQSGTDYENLDLYEK